MRKIWGIFVVLLLLAGCSDTGKTKEKDEAVLLKISAAVSLTDVLNEIKEPYEQLHGVELSFNLAGSGTLAQQIQQGAPVDVFISANENWVETLQNEQLLIPETKATVTGNRLVLIAHKDANIAIQSFEDLDVEDVSEIAIGNPESVPAGKYTEEALSSLNLWDSVQKKTVFAKDVRQVLTYVETGNADIGFVYESDALSSDQIKILATADANEHEPIVYPGAVVANTKHEKAATDFLNYLLTEDVQAIFSKHGFQK